MSVKVEVKGEIIYPESEGKPMADDTLQAHYIVYLFDNLKALFRDDPLSSLQQTCFGIPLRASQVYALPLM